MSYLSYFIKFIQIPPPHFHFLKTCKRNNHNIIQNFPVTQNIIRPMQYYCKILLTNKSYEKIISFYCLSFSTTNDGGSSIARKWPPVTFSIVSITVSSPFQCRTTNFSILSKTVMYFLSFPCAGSDYF